MPSMQPLYISATVVAVVMPIMAPLDPVSIYGVAAPAKWAALKGRWAPPPGAQDRREQIALAGEFGLTGVDDILLRRIFRFHGSASRYSLG